MKTRFDALSQFLHWLTAVLVLIANGAMLLLCHRYAGTPPSEISNRKWTRRFVVAEFFGGAAWSVILVLVPAEAHGVEVFQFATMLVVVSVITSLASTVPAAAVAGTIPITVTLVAVRVTLTCASTNGPDASWLNTALASACPLAVVPPMVRARVPDPGCAVACFALPAASMR